MKRIFNIAASSLIALIFACGVFTACEDAKYDTLSVHAFIGESLLSMGDKLTIVEGGVNTQVSVRLSDKVATDTEFELTVDQEVLDLYNKIYNTGYEVIPLTNSDGTTNYEMKNKLKIPAGQYSAFPVKIHFNQLNIELSNTGESYALPLKLVSTDGKVPTMEKTSCYVITLEGVFEFKSPLLNGSINALQAAMPNGTEQYNEWTVETRFQISNTANRNRFVFSSGPTSEGGVFMRFEDPNPGGESPENPLHSWIQMDTGLGWANAKMPFKTDEWQHVAMTSNGTQMSLYVNGKLGVVGDFARPTTSFKAMEWFNSAGWWTGCKILVAETRVWSSCRTEGQIVNNITTVSPKSKDLVAYWKFTEGAGNEIKDMTGKNHTITISGPEVDWISGIKSTDTKTPWP